MTAELLVGMGFQTMILIGGMVVSHVRTATKLDVLEKKVDKINGTAAEHETRISRIEGARGEQRNP